MLNMSNIETFHPQLVQRIIEFNKPLARRKFPEPKMKPKCKGGAKHNTHRWVKAILCVIGRMTNTKWRQLPDKLKSCSFLITEGYMTRIPKKSTLHNTWNEINASQFQSWVRQLGTSLALASEDNVIASDSSGIEIGIGSIGKYVSYTEEKLKKQSSLFRKNHMTVSLPSRVIVTAHFQSAKNLTILCLEQHGYSRQGGLYLSWNTVVWTKDIGVKILQVS